MRVLAAPPLVARAREKLLVASSSIRGRVLTILMAGSLSDALTVLASK